MHILISCISSADRGHFFFCYCSGHFSLSVSLSFLLESCGIKLCMLPCGNVSAFAKFKTQIEREALRSSYCRCGLPLLNFYECVESVLEKKKKCCQRPKDHENVSCGLVAAAKLPLLYETNIFWIIFQSILSSARLGARGKVGRKSGPKNNSPAKSSSCCPHQYSLETRKEIAGIESKSYFWLACFVLV